MKRSGIAMLILSLVLVTPRESRAGDPLEDFPDAAAAQSLLLEARALMAKNRYAEACPRLVESLRIEQAIRTQLDLADCNEHIGRVTTAWAGFLDVAARAKAVRQTAREAYATTRAQALVPRLPRLVIDVSNPVPGLEVKRDGVLVVATEWGEPIPVDPGVHRITAMVPGARRWATRVTSAEGVTARVELPRELLSPRAPATSLDEDTPDTTPTDLATTLDEAAPDATTPLVDRVIGRGDIVKRASIAGAAVLLGNLSTLEDRGALVFRRPQP